jgi:hypothetical protein
MEKRNNPPPPGAKPAFNPDLFTPEAEANARINVLQEHVTRLEAEVKTLDGRLHNRNPAVAEALRKENEALRERVSALIRALNTLVGESLLPRHPEDQKVQLEALRHAAIEFCKKENINPEIWKNIVY